MCARTLVQPISQRKIVIEVITGVVVVDGNNRMRHRAQESYKEWSSLAGHP